jgi:hypothetical protein
MKEMENQLTEVKATCSRNEDGLQKVQEEVSKLAERVSKQEKKVEEVAAVSGQDVFAELREREARKTNVVMYGIGEAPKERIGHERWDWDMKSCNNLFTALKLDVKMEGIKFCRRVGERGGPLRPIIVGFYEERDRNIVLRCDTRGTSFKDVEIGLDQTKKQKQEEMDMKAEAGGTERCPTKIGQKTWHGWWWGQEGKSAWSRSMSVWRWRGEWEGVE